MGIGGGGEGDHLERGCRVMSWLGAVLYDGEAVFGVGALLFDYYSEKFVLLNHMYNIEEGYSDLLIPFHILKHEALLWPTPNLIGIILCRWFSCTLELYSTAIHIRIWIESSKAASCSDRPLVNSLALMCCVPSLRPLSHPHQCIVNISSFNP